MSLPYDDLELLVFEDDGGTPRRDDDDDRDRFDTPVLFVLTDRPTIDRTPNLFAAFARECGDIHRTHAVAIHSITLGVIAFSLLVDSHFKPADWAFFALSVLTEIKR